MKSPTPYDFVAKSNEVISHINTSKDKKNMPMEPPPPPPSPIPKHLPTALHNSTGDEARIL